MNSIFLATLWLITTTPEQSAHARATRLFREKKYDEACPLFEKALASTGNYAAALNDLGLCEMRRGRYNVAVNATHRAIREGDEKVRKAAYFNLQQLGVRIQPYISQAPGSTPEEPLVNACRTLLGPPEMECTDPLRACLFEELSLGDRGHGSITFWRLEPCKGRCSAEIEPLSKATQEKFVEAYLLFDGATPPLTMGSLMVSQASVPFPDSSLEVQCDLVHVDPCRKRAGLVCKISKSGRKPELRVIEAPIMMSDE